MKQISNSIKFFLLFCNRLAELLVYQAKCLVVFLPVLCSDFKFYGVNLPFNSFKVSKIKVPVKSFTLVTKFDKEKGTADLHHTLSSNLCSNFASYLFTNISTFVRNRYLV